MTEAPIALASPRSADSKVVVSVSAAHFVSHYYILVLPPLYAFVRNDYGVSYTELGLALAAFNVKAASLNRIGGSEGLNCKDSIPSTLLGPSV